MLKFSIKWKKLQSHVLAFHNKHLLLLLIKKNKSIDPCSFRISVLIHLVTSGNNKYILILKAEESRF